MGYSLEVAESLTTVLSRFVTLNAYQLAGHAENADFWADEVVHVLAVLDGYDRRSRSSRDAQRRHIAARDTRRFTAAGWKDAAEFPDSEEYALKRAEADPRGVDAAKLREVRRTLSDTYYRVLQRMHNEQLIDAERALDLLKRCGMDSEPSHFVN